MRLPATLLMAAALIIPAATAADRNAEERHRIKYGRDYPRTEAERLEARNKKDKDKADKAAKSKQTPRENESEASSKTGERSVE